MTTFQYTITDEVGIHARPAGLLVKEVKQYDTTVMIECNGKTADAKKLMAVMAMGVKKGDTVTVSVEDDAVASNIEAFFKANL